MVIKIVVKIVIKILIVSWKLVLIEFNNTTPRPRHFHQDRQYYSMILKSGQLGQVPQPTFWFIRDHHHHPHQDHDHDGDVLL